MNKNQKIILYVCAIIIALLFLFPPFYFKKENGMIIDLGYGFILNPPEVSSSYATYSGIINVETLFIEWLGIMTISILIVVANSKNN